MMLLKEFCPFAFQTVGGILLLCYVRKKANGVTSSPFSPAVNKLLLGFLGMGLGVVVMGVVLA